MNDLLELVDRLRREGGAALHVGGGAQPHIRVKDRLVRIDDVNVSEASLRAAVCGWTSEAVWNRVVGGEPADFPCEVGGERYRARCFLRHNPDGGTGPTLILRSTANMSTFEHLGLPRTVQRLAHLRRGLVVIAGPTGAGKSTTVGAFLNEIETGRAKHVVTIESPIELTHQHQRTTVSQREIPTHAASFASALRSALRQSPDVIYVSELPDAETVQLALEAVAAGALLVATVRASGVMRALESIVDRTPTNRRATLNGLAEHLSAAISLLRLQRADGLGHCVAAEILVRSRAVVAALRDDDIDSIAGAMKRGENMQTMDEALAELLEHKRIALEDAFDHARDKQRFQGRRGARRVMRHTRFEP